ncbi:retention module-containing protein, partial [Pokkaliibacter sp. CJK22405]|uniref:retention module-containing protein n=1 Tax=Pokkaliibacter sp. CJK22405 TaxID=3384615 RepID=UPI0039852046
MATEIGRVTAVMGQVTVRTPEGEVKTLAMGDIINMNDMVQTGPGATVVISFNNGSQMALGESDAALLDSTVIPADGQPMVAGDMIDDGSQASMAQTAAAPGADNMSSIDAIQQAILAGVDPTQVLEATAAGGAPAAGAPGTDGGGFTVVTIDRLGLESTPEAGFDTTGPAAATTDDTTQVTAADPVVVAAADPVDALVSISGPDNIAEGSTGTFTLTLDQTPTTDVVVQLTYSGTATDGSDYTAVTSVTIPAGSNSATFDLTTIDDNLAEGSEDLTISIGTVTGGGFNTVGASGTDGSITTNIVDEDPATDPTPQNTEVSITGPDSIVEGQTGTFTVTLSQTPTTDVTVQLTYSGTA